MSKSLRERVRDAVLKDRTQGGSTYGVGRMGSQFKTGHFNTYVPKKSLRDHIRDRIGHGHSNPRPHEVPVSKTRHLKVRTVAFKDPETTTILWRKSLMGRFRKPEIIRLIDVTVNKKGRMM